MNYGRERLCESCRWSTVIRGPKVGDEIVECNQLSYVNNRIPFPVTSCTDYVNRNQFNLPEMIEMALMLKVEPRRTQAGFGPGTPASDEPVVLTED